MSALNVGLSSLRSFLYRRKYSSLCLQISLQLFLMCEKAFLYFWSFYATFFFLPFFTYFARRANPALPHGLMTFYSVNISSNNKLKVVVGKIDVKINHHIIEPKSIALGAMKIDSSSSDAIHSEKSATQKTNGEGDTLSSKELASLDSLGRRFGLEIPKTPLEQVLTPAQQVAQDPRTNSARLTKSEKFAVAFGALDCIFQTRLANGTIIRVLGQWIVGPARSEPGLKTLAKSRFCVRFHQQTDEDGNDLTAISSGIKGKL